MAAKANSNLNNTNGRKAPVYARHMVPRSLLGRTYQSEAVARAKEWQDRRDACKAHLTSLVGELPESLTTAFTVMYEQFRGVAQTTPAQVEAIHAAYIKVSTWAHIRLLQLGRSTFCISPMLAAPLSWTTVELSVTGEEGESRFPICRHSDGFSAICPELDKRGNVVPNHVVEIGSLGDDFGVLYAFKGATFEDSSGKAKVDRVKMCVYTAPDMPDGRMFNELVRNGDGDAVKEIVKKLHALRHSDPAFAVNREKARTKYNRWVDELTKQIDAGSEAAMSAVIAATGSDDAANDNEIIDAAKATATVGILASAAPVANAAEQDANVVQERGIILAGSAEQAEEIVERIISNVIVGDDTPRVVEAVVESEEQTRAREAAHEKALEDMANEHAKHSEEARAVLKKIDDEIAKRAAAKQDEANILAAADLVIRAEHTKQVDRKNVAWDPRVHVSPAEKTTKGTWRKLPLKQLAAKAAESLSS